MLICCFVCSVIRKKICFLLPILYFRDMILITGATGLVGSHLALQLLEKGEKLRAMTLMMRIYLGKPTLKEPPIL